MSILCREDLPFARIYVTVEEVLLPKYSSKQTEPEFVNLLRSPGIDSPYLTYRPACMATYAGGIDSWASSTFTNMGSRIEFNDCLYNIAPPKFTATVPDTQCVQREGKRREEKGGHVINPFTVAGNKVVSQPRAEVRILLAVRAVAGRSETVVLSNMGRIYHLYRSEEGEG